MAEAAPSLHSEILDCPICLEKYQTPRTLPCLHTFCEVCLDSFILSHSQDGSAFPCPICRNPTVATDTNLKVELWAKSFPLNHMVISLMDTRGIQNVEKTLCDSCRNNNEDVPAVKWCKQCFVGYCDTCDGFHKRITATSNHETITIEEANQEDRYKKPYSIDEGCPRHRGKNLEVFCLDHRELCCVLCFVTGHRECKSIRDIDELSEEQETKGEQLQFVNNLNEIKGKMEQLENEKRENISTVDKEQVSLSTEIEGTINEAKQRLDKLLLTYRDDLSRNHTVCSVKLTNTVKQIQSFVSNTETSCKLMMSALNHGSPRQSFVTYEKLHCQIISHYKQLKSDLADDKLLSLSYKVDDVWKMVLDKLNSLGSVEISESSSASISDTIANVGMLVEGKSPKSAVSEDDLSIMSRDQLDYDSSLASSENDDTLSSFRDFYDAGENKKELQERGSKNAVTDTGLQATSYKSTSVLDLMAASVSLIKIVSNTKNKRRNNSYFSCGIFLNNGHLLFADRGNHRLIEYNTEWVTTRRIKLDENPSTMSMVNQNNELWLSLFEKKTIQRYEIRSELIPRSQIKMDVDTWGVADCEQFVITGKMSHIDIYTKDGMLIRSIPKQARFRSYVAVSKSGDALFHEDEDAIICRHINGEQIFRYRNRGLRTPGGIGLDKYGNIYVCGKDSGNVHQISGDGTRSRILLNKLRKIKKPVCVVVHPTENLFVVTSYRENAAFEVYRFNIW